MIGEPSEVDEPTDADVIRRSLCDPRAFAVLFDRHGAVVLRFLVRRVGPDAADELLGDAFRIAFERRATFDERRVSIRPWLYGIATNLVAKQRRSEARRLRAIGRIAVERPADSLADDVIATVEARRGWPAIAEAIAKLPAGERDALLLYAWEELSYEEIGSALGIPLGTVRSRLNRARRRLREPAAPNGEQADESQAAVQRGCAR
jgi:RNA polymerase sigma-70 factor (ECF subfamily)